MVLGLVLGVGLAILDRIAPRTLKAWLPSASGLGIAMVLPGSNSISIFLGTAVAELLRRRYPKIADDYTVPIGSGFIAGESLMGVAVIMLTKIAGLSLAL